MSPPSEPRERHVTRDRGDHAAAADYEQFGTGQRGHRRGSTGSQACHTLPAWRSAASRRWDGCAQGWASRWSRRQQRRRG